jgi:NTE family protein
MPARNPPRNDRPRVGLVLGSGGARGIVHIPVIEALAALKIPVDLIAGSSIGAAVAGVHAVGRLQDLKGDLLAMKRDAFLRLFDPVLSRSGLFAGKRALTFLARYIPKDALIEDLPVPLGIVASDFDSGRSVVFRKGSLLAAIRASVSIPGIFTPMAYGRSLYLDGGVVSPLPIDVARSMGADLTIAVSLHPALGKLGFLPIKRTGRGKKTAGPAGRVPAVERLVHKLVEDGPDGAQGLLKAADLWFDSQRAAGDSKRKVPNLFDILTRTIDIMENSITQLMLSTNPPTVLINFDLPEIPTLDFSLAPYLLEEGRRAAEAKATELLEKIKEPAGRHS